MTKSKMANIAILSIVGRAIKILAAPITLLIISKKLTSAELAFYYTFFSIVSMQQLAELGLGQVMRQSISHSYNKEKSALTISSAIKIAGYFKLTVVWFAFVSFFILMVVGIVGYHYLNIADSNVSWQGPWWALVISTALTTMCSPISILLEGCQKQNATFRANIVVGTIYSVTLWIGLLCGINLYSIAIAILISTITMLLILVKPTLDTISMFSQQWKATKIKNIFIDIYPYLGRVSVVWGCSYFYWNAFGLVSIPLFGADTAGKILLAVALAKAGFDVAKAIVQGQTTLYGHMISQNKANQAKQQFKKYFLFSLLLLVIGYTIFFVAWFLFSDFYLFDMIPDKGIVIQIFIYFLILLLQTNSNNFVRCYKIEPFVKQYIILALCVIPIFYISGLYIYEYSFIPCSLLLLTITTYNFKTIYKKYIGK